MIMSGATRVFASTFGGTFLAAYAGPEIVKMLPDSLKTKTMSSIVAASIAGGAAVLTWYVLGAVVK
jgi:hypothetical protein